MGRAKKLHCFYCNHTFKTILDLEAHLCIIHGFVKVDNFLIKEISLESPYHFCNKCGRGFESEVQVDEHLVASHGNSDFRVNQIQSDTSDIKFENEDNFVKHRLQVHTSMKNEVFDCEKCEYRSIFKEKIEHHQVHLHEEFNNNLFKYSTLELMESTQLNENKLEYNEESVKKNQKLESEQCEDNLSSRELLPKSEIQCHSIKNEKIQVKLGNCEQTQEKAILDKIKVFKYQCEQCEYATNNKRYLKTHMSKFHKHKLSTTSSNGSKSSETAQSGGISSNKLKCPISSEMNQLSENENDHTEKSLNKRPKLECDQCEEIFSGQELLEGHKIQTHSTNNEEIHIKNENCNKIPEEVILNKNIGLRYKCEQCEFATNAKKCLNGHMDNEDETSQNDPAEVDNESDSKIVTCDQCHKSFLSDKFLKTHIFRAHKKRCKKCGKKFRNRLELRQHVANTHTKPKVKSVLILKVPKLKVSQLQCKICHQFYSNFTALNVHKSAVHNQSQKACPRKKVNKCESCNENFRTFADLDDHECELQETAKLNDLSYQIAQKSLIAMMTYSCNLCPNVNFKSTKLLASHVKSFHGLKKQRKSGEKINCDAIKQKKIEDFFHAKFKQEEI